MRELQNCWNHKHIILYANNIICPWLKRGPHRETNSSTKWQQRDEFCYDILMMSLKPFTLEIGDLLSSVQSKIKFMHNLSHV